MSSHFDKTIEEMTKRLREQEAEVIKTKEMINMLCQYAGKDPIYMDAQLEPSTASGAIRSDEFYGQPLARAVRKILELRKAANQGPATVKEIFETLVQGGYQFDAKNDQNAMRGLRISLAKNTAVFHKLPQGQFGLVQWYPKIAQSKQSQAGKALDDNGNGNGEKAEDNNDADEKETQ